MLKARQNEAIGDTLLLLEHSPVITLGKGAKEEHVLFSKETLNARDVDLVATTRGGDVTYHGPGQLVGYPIVSLAPDRCDVRRFVGDLIDLMTALAADYGVSAGIIDEYPGIWVDLESPNSWPGKDKAKRPAKLGAVGLRISKWVTMHGFAFNASPDLRGFGLIVPCGIKEFDVTSLDECVGTKPQPADLARRAAEQFCTGFGAKLESYAEVDAGDDELGQIVGCGS